MHGRRTKVYGPRDVTEEKNVIVYIITVSHIISSS